MLGKFEAADNMDLGLILSDYEAYYSMRFDKKPKLVRKLSEAEEVHHAYIYTRHTHTYTHIHVIHTYTHTHVTCLLIRKLPIFHTLSDAPIIVLCTMYRVHGGCPGRGVRARAAVEVARAVGVGAPRRRLVAARRRRLQ